MNLQYGDVDGHGTYGQLTEGDGSGLICHECGAERQFLGWHVREHGHVEVPDDHVTAEGFGLGKWVAYQRARHRGTKKGQSIPSEQVQELSELGMRW